MLDDLAKIKAIDVDNALAVAATQPDQLNFSDYQFQPPHFEQIDNVVLTGMGGSALAGLVCRNWWDDRLAIPFIITRDYKLPGFVSNRSLVIASSYSGNTDETLSAVKDAANKKARIIVLAANGKLEHIAKTKGYPHLSAPKGYQPRLAVWFEVRMLADIFEQLGLVDKSVDELSSAYRFLKNSVAQYLPAVPSLDNQAKRLAERLKNKAVVIYAGPALAAAAYKWKININENAKSLAFCNVLPEADHNEIAGWVKAPKSKAFAVIELLSDFDYSQVKKRFGFSNQLLKNRMPEPITVQAQGKTKIEQLLWTILLGDFASIYLAILTGVNPTSVEVIEKLKQKLA